MSDFLGRCAARALDLEPSLRPRVASRFEPEAAALVGAGVPTNALGEMPLKTLGPSPAGVPPPDLTPDPSPIAPPSPGRGAPPPKAALTPGPSPASGRGVQGRGRATPVDAQGNRHSRSQVHSLPAFPHPTSPPTPLPSPTPPTGRGAPPPDPREHEPDKLPPLPGDGWEMGEGGRGGEVGRGEASAPDTREVSVAPQKVQRQPPPPPARSREAGSERIGELGAHEEPPIRVTIGRIEVRATAPAPPPAPRPAAGPRMNLEDYLRRRGEGRL